jgi:DNA mismatch endonuclease (patch repair protein)
VPERWREPFASSEAVRRRMSVQRRSGTGPELALRRALFARGLRYRVDVAPLPGLRRKADVVFSSAKLAVFVDGCFWHGCPEHGRRRHEVNGWYWPAKIDGNRRRDRETDQVLAAAGWRVLRVWEHELVGGAYQVAEHVRALVAEQLRASADSSGFTPAARS